MPFNDSEGDIITLIENIPSLIIKLISSEVINGRSPGKTIVHEYFFLIK